MGTDLPRFICVLGGANSDRGVLRSRSRDRVEKAAEVYKCSTAQGHRVTILATGGFGPFNKSSTAHNRYSKAALMEQGVPECDVVVEGLESANTVEDAIFAGRFLSEQLDARILVITSDFHMERSGLIFKAVMPDHDVTILGVASSQSIDSTRLAHEQRSLMEIKARGFIYYDNEKYPLLDWRLPLPSSGGGFVRAEVRVG